MTLRDIGTALPDFYDPNTFVEGVPHAAFAALRETDGLYWQNTEGTDIPGFWIATRRDDILLIENDPATFTSSRGISPHAMSTASRLGQAGTIMHVDPPEHSRLRRVVAKSLAPRVVANFETWVRDIITEALDNAVPLGEFDFVSQVAALIPSRTIAKVVGFPDELRDSIVTWTNNLFDASQRGDVARASAITDEIEDLADRLRVGRLRTPSDDLISYLAPFERDGEISNWDYRKLVRNFINAGFETTHTTMSQSVRLLVEDQTAAIRFDEVMATEGATPIVDECVRLVSPVMTFFRVATQDTEVAGTKIKAGDVVSQWYTAANRDPRIFERPDEFIPRRPNSGDHLAFGAGVHRCIGAPLARLQIRILLEEIHRRGIRFDINGKPRRGWSSFINQLTYLPLKVMSGH